MTDKDSVLPVDFSLVPSRRSGRFFDVLDEEGRVLNRSQFRRAFPKAAERIDAERENQASPGGPRILVEGDSWTEILWPASSVLGHQRNFIDVMERTLKYNFTNFGWPGDTLQNMLVEQEYAQSLKSKTYDIFIFSGAGNDVIGSGALFSLAQSRAYIDPSKDPSTWIAKDIADLRFEQIRSGYVQICKQNEVWGGGKTKLLTHGYDYVEPVSGGSWLGGPLERRGYDLVRDADTIKKLIKYLIDRLHQTLEATLNDFEDAHLVDVRDTVKGRWNDELHANKEGSAAVADKFMNYIDGLAATG
jgi:hypothetical protein